MLIYNKLRGCYGRVNIFWEDVFNIVVKEDFVGNSMLVMVKNSLVCGKNFY